MLESIQQNPRNYYKLKLKKLSVQDKLAIFKVFLSQDTYAIPIDLYKSLLTTDADTTNRLLLSKRFIRYGQNPTLGENRCFTK